MLNKNSGLTFVEYALILGVVAAVFVGMNVYIKRSIQGKVKDMTDVLISPKQEGEASSGVYSESSSKTTSDTISKSRFLRGGGTSLSLEGNTLISGSGYSEEYDVEGDDNYDFVSSEKGAVSVVERVPDSEFESSELKGAIGDPSAGSKLDR